MNFVSQKRGEVVIEKIKITRGTYKEAEELKKIINNNIEQGNLFIVLDFKKCEFIDSTFLSTIVTSLKKLIDLGGTIKIANVHSEAQELLELTRTNQVLEVFSSIKEALKSFKK